MKKGKTLDQDPNDRDSFFPIAMLLDLFCSLKAAVCYFILFFTLMACIILCFGFHNWVVNSGWK